MYLCSDRHAKVCFEGKKCPFCEVLDQHAKTVEDLQEKLADLKGALDVAIRVIVNLQDKP